MTPWGSDPERPRRVRRVVVGSARLVAALVSSALVGLLVAGLVLPAVGSAGLAAKQTADVFLELPEEFTSPRLPQRSRLLAADGSVLAHFFVEDRVSVPLSAVPEHTVDALLAVEDARFRDHRGVDVKGMLRAAFENAAAGSIEQGGSTITQQYVKNALLAAADSPREQDEATELSLERKLREARLAIALERRLSKDQILERYLDIAYFGNGAYGIAAAAGRYFSKPVQELTVAEGALLVGLLRDPAGNDPLEHLPEAVDRRDVVLHRMAEVGSLTRSALRAALDEAPDLRPTAIASGCQAPGVTAAFFCDHVRRALESGPLGEALGTTRAQRQQQLLSGGLTIWTTLHPPTQAVAERALVGAVPADDPSGVSATFTAVEPRTGAVKAVAVNEVFGDQPGQTELNLALGGSSGMQGGSTFKPFVLAAAVEQGIPLDLTLEAPARYASSVFVDCDGRTCDAPYVVHNAGDSSAGTYDVVGATHSSVNTFYVQLLERTGVRRPAEIAEGLGLRQFADGRPAAPLHRGGSFVLGTDDISPLDLTAAYAAFAASGTYCPPRPVTRILDAAGQEVPLPAQTCRQVLAPEVADTVTSVLRGSIDGPSATRTGAAASIGRPAAGKTGSTNGSRAAWFVGYTPQLAAAVWVGKPVPEDLRDITIGGRTFRQVYGGSLPAPVWRAAMSAIHAGLPRVDLPPIAASNPQPLG